MKIESIKLFGLSKMLKEAYSKEKITLLGFKLSFIDFERSLKKSIKNDVKEKIITFTPMEKYSY